MQWPGRARGLGIFQNGEWAGRKKCEGCPPLLPHKRKHTLAHDSAECGVNDATMVGVQNGLKSRSRWRWVEEYWRNWQVAQRGKLTTPPSPA